MFTAPDCISRSTIASTQKEYAKTGGGNLTYVSDLVRAMQTGIHVRLAHCSC